MSTQKETYDEYVQGVRERNQAGIDEVVPKLRAIYDSGTPFFTKEAMRDIMRQVREVEKAHLESEKEKLDNEKGKPGMRSLGTVSVVGLDGNTVELNVRTGSVHQAPGDNPGLECVSSNADLRYSTIDHLTIFSDPLFFVRERAYLPIEISHRMLFRDVVTKASMGDMRMTRDKKFVPLLSVPFEEAQERFFRRRAEWDASEQCAELKAVLDKAEIPPIRKIVAFACSSLKFEHEVSNRSAAQHALILTVRDWLATRKSSESDGSGIECYAQDPVYSDVDKKILGDVGFTVLDDPDGFLELDETTLVFSFGADVPVREITADLTRPAMMIWDGIEPKELPEIDGMRVWTDPVTPRLVKLAEEYTRIPLPDSEDWCEGTSIYIRKKAVL